MNNILVTVTVITYNSSVTVLETLESIKNQTYDNIELVISDDCSNDDTVIKCKEWLKINQWRFVNVMLLTAERNQGVCINGNKAKKAANGIWIKGIAADDILFPNCISDFVQFANQHPEAKFITSCMSIYDETFEEKNCIDAKRCTFYKDIYDQSLDVQLKGMAYYEYVLAPPSILKKELFESVGGYSEKYEFEDWPFFLDILEKGNRIYFLDKVTVGYRFHASLSHLSDKIFKYSFLVKTRKFVKERCFKYYPFRKKFATRLQWFLEDAMHTLNMDKNSKYNSFVYRKGNAICRKLGGWVC